MNSKIKIDLLGQVFGRLTVVHPSNPLNGRTAWVCSCDCGNVLTVKTKYLRNGDTKSCGCLTHDNKPLLTHGDSESDEYDIWCAMKARCYRVGNNRQHRYKDRGIIVCDRWLHSYENFLEDMGRRPSKKHSLDRTNNDGHYEPLNCRWATPTQQRNNTSRNINIVLNNETHTLKEWAEIHGINYQIVYSRYRKGWPISDIYKAKSKNSPHHNLNKLEQRPII